jgi:hypothetical protein
LRIKIVLLPLPVVGEVYDRTGHHKACSYEHADQEFGGCQIFQGFPFENGC